MTSGTSTLTTTPENIWSKLAGYDSQLVSDKPDLGSLLRDQDYPVEFLTAWAQQTSSKIKIIVIEVVRAEAEEMADFWCTAKNVALAATSASVT